MVKAKARTKPAAKKGTKVVKKKTAPVRIRTATSLKQKKPQAKQSKQPLKKPQKTSKPIKAAKPLRTVKEKKKPKAKIIPTQKPLIKESPKILMIPSAPVVLLLSAPKVSEEKQSVPRIPANPPPPSFVAPTQTPTAKKTLPKPPEPPVPVITPSPSPQTGTPTAQEHAPIGGIHQITPALEMLPDWEDRLRLRRVIFEDGLGFFSLGKGSNEFDEAFLMLNQTHKLPHSDLHDYFLVCAKDRSGKIVAVMDGHALSDALLVIGRSYAGGPKKRELQILLYAAALAGRKPSFVVCYTKLGAFSMESAGRLIFFGRGLGMSAIPLKTSHLIFVRRMRKELDPISSGSEIAGLLLLLKIFGELELDAHIAEFQQKTVVALVPLPTSPDSREHLHELKDVVAALELTADQFEAVIATLRADYVSGRKDITPETL